MDNTCPFEVAMKSKSWLSNFAFLLLQQTFAMAEQSDNITSNENYQSNLNCTDGIMLSRNLCLPKNYEERYPPSNKTEVVVDFSFGNFREVNDKKMTITFDVMLEYTWKDSRISKAFVEGLESILRKDLGKIWKPRVYVENLKSYRQRFSYSSYDQLKFEQLNVFNFKDAEEFFEIESFDYNETNAFVSHRVEAQIILYCHFKFNAYPMDTQVCIFKLGSPDLNNEHQVLFKLRPSVGLDCFYLDGDTSPDGNALQDFEVETNCYSARGSPRTLRSLMSDVNDSVAINITLTRIMRPFFMKYYLPSMAIALLSEISFIIPMKAIPARTALLATLFLALINLFIAQQVKLRLSISK